MRAASFHVALPRHPLLRALVLIVGVVLLVGLITMGLLIGATVVAVAALALLVRRWLHGRGGRKPDPGIIEGEFSVVPPRARGSLPHTEA